MKYNLKKEIWYSKEDLYANPPFIDDFEIYLSKGIGKRVKKIKDDYNLTQREMHESEPRRISRIEKGEYHTVSSKKYSSFITDAILFDIIEATKEAENRKKNSLLPETITRFWIIFGNETDLHEFIKGIYYNFCLRILSNTQTQDSEQADIIQDLFYADAGFSFIYGQAKINNQDINTEPNVKERRALVDAVKYTWNIISDEVLAEFRNSFDHDDPNAPYYLDNSRKINKQIHQWCQEILLPYLIDKQKELKKDSVANIGYCVHNLMEMLAEKKDIDSNSTLRSGNDNLELILNKDNEYLLDCAKNLVESQRTYFDNLRNHELEISIAESVEESRNYELEGDFYQIGTDNIISFDNSGKTFEELINEAIKTCRNK